MPSLLIATTVHETVDAFLVPYADHFRALGWQVDVMAAGAEGCATCRDHSDATVDASWERRPMATGNVAAVQRLRAVVQGAAHDLVHVHTPVAAYLTRFALRPRHRVAHRPSVVYTAHGFHFDESSSWRSRPFELLERGAGRWTDHLIVINDEDHDWAVRNRVVPEGALEHMPGIGLDLDHYTVGPALRAQADDIRLALGAGPRRPVFTMVAEFIPRKRHADVIAALGLVGLRDAQVVFVGDGPLREQARQLAEAGGVSARCHFVGRRADVRPYVLAADALLLPSTREGLPRSVLEAMSLGVPAIGTDIRGTRSLLGEQRGRLVPTQRPAQLAAAMAAVWQRPFETLRQVDRARRHVRRFGIDHLLTRHEHTYERLLADRGVRPVTTGDEPRPTDHRDEEVTR